MSDVFIYTVPGARRKIKAKPIDKVSARTMSMLMNFQKFDDEDDTALVINAGISLVEGICNEKDADFLCGEVSSAEMFEFIQAWAESASDGEDPKGE